MRSTFKLTLAALAVSIVLSGCKSSQGPSIVADSPPPKEITATDGNDKEKPITKRKSLRNQINPILNRINLLTQKTQ